VANAPMNVPTAMTAGRPTGVTILAVLAGIGGVLGLLFGLLTVLLGGALGAAGAGPLGALAGAFGFILLILGVLYLVLAYGMWGLRPWAWTLGLGLAIVGIVFGVLWLLSGDIATALVQLVINGVIAYYLWQPSIKATFGRPA
jgi:hypothetical protein